MPAVGLAEFGVDRRDDRRVLAARAAAAGWPIGVPSSPANAELLLVVEVVLVAEEDHLVGQQRRADLLDRGRVEVAAEAHSVDLGADAAAQLRYGYLDLSLLSSLRMSVVNDYIVL